MRADKPWYTAELSQEKRLRRKYERKYKQSKLTVDKLQLQEQRNKYNTLLNSTKKDYIKNKIENAESSKVLYRVCDKLLNREQKAILPSHDCAQSLANTFVNYFNEKLNWFETTLNHHWIHQRIKFQTVFPYSVVSPSNNLMLFQKLVSGRLLAHHQRNRAPLTWSLHGYSNNAKTNWHLFLQLL